MSEELDILKIVCHKLEQANISYMLTGSLAANFYTIPRLTRDIDIVIEINKFEIDKLLYAFQNEFYVDRDSIADSMRHQGMFNIIHNDSVFKIDFIIRKDIAYRDTEFKRRQRILLDNSPIWIVAPEDLIISKLYWAKDSISEIQLNDIKNLFSSVKNLDKNYIDKWVQELKLNSIYAKVQKDA